MRRLTLDDIIKRGRPDEYEYLELVLKHKETHIKIKCKKCGTIFEQRTSDHLNKCCGCKKCSDKLHGESKRLSIKDVIERGRPDEYDYLGIFMGQNGKQIQTFIKIRCKKCGSEFQQTSNHHLNEKIGCPTCCEMKREKLCRNLLEQITSSILKRDIKFNKVRPDWLINPITKQKLELDGYNEELKIAFEHNGEQHYKYHRRFHRTREDFTNQQYRDLIKYQTLTKHNIKLLIIPYSVKENELKTFIEDFIYTNYNVFHFTDTNEYKLCPAAIYQ